MPATTPPTAAERLRAQAEILLDLADEYEQPSYSMLRVELLIGRVEQHCIDTRAIVRGR